MGVVSREHQRKKRDRGSGGCREHHKVQKISCLEIRITTNTLLIGALVVNIYVDTGQSIVNIYVDTVRNKCYYSLQNNPYFATICISK